MQFKSQNGNRKFTKGFHVGSVQTAFNGAYEIHFKHNLGEMVVEQDGGGGCNRYSVVPKDLENMEAYRGTRTTIENDFMVWMNENNELIAEVSSEVMLGVYGDLYPDLVRTSKVESTDALYDCDTMVLVLLEAKEAKRLLAR